jgi:hypothetical protein
LPAVFCAEHPAPMAACSSALSSLLLYSRLHLGTETETLVQRIYLWLG